MQDKSPIGSPDSVEVNNSLSKFFSGLGKLNGKELLKNIRGKFPVEASSGDLLALKIDELIRTY